MTGHPDADVLAEFREGLLGRRRSARIQAHLAGCPRCASLCSGLAEVTELLARAPAPAIPDELAARLDRVLAAESAARARGGTPATAAQPPAAGEIPAAAAPGPGAGDRGRAPGQAGRRPGRRRPAARPARPRPWRVPALRAASVTAAILVLAGGGYGVSRLLPGGTGTAASGSHFRAGSGPHRARGAEPPANQGLQPNVVLPTAGIRVIRSGTDYLPGRLPAQAEAVLDRHPAGSAGSAAVLPGSAHASALSGCLRLITGGVPPALVDMARYRGRPATIIMQAAEGRTALQVWVVGPGCSATRRDLITQVTLPVSG